jgi:pyrophosphatase PpaX
MKNYDTYLFDWDGTLARTIEIWLSEIARQYTAYGLTISEADNARNFGNLKSPLQYGLPMQQLSEFQEGINAAVKVRLPDVPLYDDAHETLVALKQQGKKLALVTTSLRRNLDVVMSKHGVEELFDVIVTSEDVKKHKPDPESINLAVERLGTDKSRAIMLGDSSHDLLAAKNAGVASVLFYPEAHSLIHDLDYLQSHGPTHMVRTWRELLDQLQ